ncbi:N-carbamoyl-D-amino-acid hydrolase, partial [Phenoliferia sp. Uapishka_3]
MPRFFRVAAAQVGAVNRTDLRSDTLARLIALLESAASQKVELVVFPELAFTTFFPRYAGLDEDQEAFDEWFEEGKITTSRNVAPFFAKAKQLGVSVCIGYGEKAGDQERYNSCSYVAGSGEEVAKYRKIHLPGTVEPYTHKGAINQLEKRFFRPGNLGFTNNLQAFRAPGLCRTEERGDPILGMMICNDRRWAESWRCLGLQGVELVLCGFNTTNWSPELFGYPADTPVSVTEPRAVMQHLLVMQAHSYTNACFSISAARAGYDDGEFGLIGASAIVDPEGQVVAQSKGVGDELVVADIDLDAVVPPKARIFDFGLHRRPECYQRITEQRGVIEPARLDTI